MYNYNFKETDESIIKEITNINIKIDNIYYQVDFVLTEKNLIAFYDIDKGNPIWGRGTHTLPELYVLFNIPLNNIKYETNDGNLYIIIDNKKVNCFDFDLELFLNK